VNLLTRGRSKGAAVFLGVQDDGQIQRIYSKELLRTIENSCGNCVTFAITGETANREARHIGETEIVLHRDSEHEQMFSVSVGINKKDIKRFLLDTIGIT
jgi:type IV secretory pathway TraG/TraD family ATPase VirD4